MKYIKVFENFESNILGRSDWEKLTQDLKDVFQDLETEVEDYIFKSALWNNKIIVEIELKWGLNRKLKNRLEHGDYYSTLDKILPIVKRLELMGLSSKVEDEEIIADRSKKISNDYSIYIFNRHTSFPSESSTNFRIYFNVPENY